MQPVLKIDLSSGIIDLFIIPVEWLRDYLGGASLAARFLYEEFKAGIQPSSPESSLLFLNGPLSGTAGPAVGRFVICGRSPATGIWGESNCGGFWGPELRKAGYDGIWITGRADEPVYISIVDKQVDIKSAEHIWGLDTYESQEAIKRESPDNHCRVAVIGPAGETQIPYALILTDHGRVAGRTGMGAIMGSKNLKGVAVRGNGVIPVSDALVYSRLRSNANLQLRSDSYTKVLRALGTSGGSDYFDCLAELPKRYFQSGSYEGVSDVSGSSMADKILAGVSACHACVIACGRVVRLEDGEKRKGPEYETMAGFGPNLLINDLNQITRWGELCDRYGMDSISISNTIGLVFKLYEMGLINKSAAGGMDLTWGNTKVIEDLIHMTARREGLGDQIALGARGLGKYFGAEAEAVQVKGLEVPYHDPRGSSGMGLVYATSPRGACHNQSNYFLVDIGQVEESLGMKYYDRQAGSEKAENVARHQDWRTVFNSLVMCQLANVPPEVVVELVNAACGTEYSLDKLLLCGERGWNLKRIINNMIGLRREDDMLPKALLMPYSDNPPGADGYVVDISAMMDAYYSARGWDIRLGIPGIKKLEELGLDWAAEDVWKK